MFIAHLPAGFLLTQALLKFSDSSALTKRQTLALILIGLSGSIFPDLDLLYFYLIDGRQHGHHSYWTHMPVFWTLLVLFSLSLSLSLKARLLSAGIIIFYLNIMLHLLLDTFVGGIFWLFPFNTSYLAFVSIKPIYGWWVWNFILHWTFALEILISSIAGLKLLTLFKSHRVNKNATLL